MRRRDRLGRDALFCDVSFFVFSSRDRVSRLTVLSRFDVEGGGVFDCQGNGELLDGVIAAEVPENALITTSLPIDARRDAILLLSSSFATTVVADTILVVVRVEEVSRAEVAFRSDRSGAVYSDVAIAAAYSVEFRRDTGEVDSDFPKAAMCIAAKDPGGGVELGGGGVAVKNVPVEDTECAGDTSVTEGTLAVSLAIMLVK